jgi:hypothetical protein
LEEFVQRGGHLVVTPPMNGGAEVAGKYSTSAAVSVLPRKYTSWYTVPEKEPSLTWTWNALSAQRPLLAVFRQYREQNDFFDKTPPTTRGFWKVEEGAKERVVVSYNDAPDPDSRSPAVLEWGVGRGRVYQFTVPMALGSERIQNYASTWFYMVLANEAVRTLTGDSEDQVFNFANGQMVLIKWPAGEAKPGLSYFLSGPDVSAADASTQRQEGQAYFRFGPEKGVAAGSFTLSSEDGKWNEGFSLNVPVEESHLERLPPEPIQELFGAETMFTADKKLSLTDILSGKFTQPIELFPFLMILLLLVLAMENWMGNKFYRKKRVGG